MKHYDWNKTLSYDTDVTMIVGARGIGKTYGLRLQVVRDYIKHKYKFAELCRYKSELQTLTNGYFARIESNNEFADYVFKSDKNRAYIAQKPKSKDAKPQWEVCGYFLALTQAQQIKKRTFDNVKRFIFDEAVLDKKDRYHHYLPGEVELIANIIDSVSRETPDTDNVRPRLYLLGNALDITNPFFSYFNVGVPNFGYTKKDNFLLHYVQNEEYSNRKMSETVAGRILGRSDAGMSANQNIFTCTGDDFIQPKTKNAKFKFGIVFRNKRFGVWVDYDVAYFVTNKIPNNAQPIYCLTIDENKLDYMQAQRAEPKLKMLAEMHYNNVLRYQTIPVREDFKQVLQMFGVR